jgi:transposase
LEHTTEGNARETLTTWAAFDKIAWELGNEVRTTALRRRLDFYRVTARDLANRFSTVVLEQDAKKNERGRSAKPMDIAKLANRKDKDPDKDLHDAAHSQRHSAATGELRDALLNAFGGAADYVPAQYTTSTCAACGALETWDRSELEHVCSKCGSHWDQDDNACKNLLAYATPESTRPVETVYEGKYAKGKRLKKEREAA